MDIDYHFGAIYVLSRWAGFGPGNAKVIAAASQFVDDNISEDIKVWNTAKEVTTDGVIRYSGHALWENLFNEDGNEEVWIPYHFLPGLEGDTEEEKLVCKKNSVMAKELDERLRSVTFYDKNYAFKLGVGLHVYADTWAHQEFAGITSIANVVKDLAVELFNEDSWTSFEKIQDMFKNIALDLASPLGHAAAIHWPDRPFAKWRSVAKFPDGRDNCQEFMEASEAIYKILAHMQENPIAELEDGQKELLMNAFTEIKDDDPEKRNEEWVSWIAGNAFGFSDFSEDDENLQYSKYFILSDEDFPKQFYDALDEHYNWVKTRLEEAGIYRLEC